MQLKNIEQNLLIMCIKICLTNLNKEAQAHFNIVDSKKSCFFFCYLHIWDSKQISQQCLFFFLVTFFCSKLNWVCLMLIMYKTPSAQEFIHTNSVRDSKFGFDPLPEG